MAKKTKGGLRKGDKHNFNELKRAFANGDVVLMDVLDVETNEQVAMICIAELDGDEYDITPIAPLINYDKVNVFARYRPPEGKDGYKGEVTR